MPLLPATRPLRVYAAMTLVDSIGMGLYSTGAVLFFTRELGFTPSFVGLGLTIAAVVGLAGAIPGGRLADRVGLRRALVPLYVAQAVLFAVLPLVDSRLTFLLVICGIALAESAGRPVRQAALSGLVGGEERIRASAYNRSVLNVGVSVGALGAGAALAVGSRLAYDLLTWGNAASFLVAAALFARLQLARTPSTGYERTRLLFSGRMAASALCCGVLYASAALLDVGLPLQVSRHTTAPRWTVAMLLLVNTVLAITLQVRASRGSHEVVVAARANRRAGVCLLAACLLFATTSGPVAGMAVALLVVATAALTAGELFFSAGQWGMSYALTPPDRQAEFLAGFGLISSAAGVAGPVLAALVVAHGWYGWTFAGAVFLTAGVVSPLIARERETAAGVTHATLEPPL